MKPKNPGIQIRIQLFNAIRDIPYKFGGNYLDTSCKSKAKLLGELLTRCGFKTYLVRSPYQPNQLKLPNRIANLAPLATYYHVFLKVLIPETNQWVNVDPTWDKPLNPIYPIANWDGLSNTASAIDCSKPKIIININGDPLSPIEATFAKFDLNIPYYQKINCYYQQIRNQYYLTQNE